MNLLTSLIAVMILTLLALGVAISAGLVYLLTVIIPYAAFAVFIVGFIYRVVQWAKAPVPFRIPRPAARRSPFPGSGSTLWTTPPAFWA